MTIATSQAAHQAASAYTPQDNDKARSVAKWLAEHEQSRAWLGRKVRIAGSTVGQVLNGKYPSSPTAMLDQMLAILQVEDARRGDGTPGYVEGSVHKLMFVVCDRTRKHSNFGVVTGSVGVGKTRSAQEYVARKPQTLLIETNPQQTAGTLLIDLLRKLGCTVPHGLDNKFAEVVKALSGTNYLLIVDEAENMSAQALHYLRRIRDKATVGVVLVGTSKLHALIKPEQGQFDQIRSRVSMWPDTIQTITRDDADDMARAALHEFGELSDDTLDTLWAYCGGSARVLMESLVTGLRDYAGKHEISSALVDQVAGKVLSLKRRGGAL